LSVDDGRIEGGDVLGGVESTFGAAGEVNGGAGQAVDEVEAGEGAFGFAGVGEDVEEEV
jgi:hypothetical protein